MLLYWPASAVPEAVNVHVSPGSSLPSLLVSPPTKVALKSSAVLPGVPLSSRTTTALSGNVSGLVTSSVQVKVEPAATLGDGGQALAVPLVFLTMLIAGATPR